MHAISVHVSLCRQLVHKETIRPKCAKSDDLYSFMQVVCTRVQSASQWRGGQLMVHMLLMCALTQWGLWRFWLRHTYIAFFPDEASNHYFRVASWIGGAFMCMTTGALAAA